MERLGEGIIRRLAIWLAASASLWFLASTAFALASAGPEAPVFALLALLSLLPAFIFMPSGEGRMLLEELRTVDDDTGIEAFLEKREEGGPAAGLLARRALRADAGIDPGKGRIRRAFRGLLPLFGAALVSLALFEAVSLALDHRPALGYRPAPSARGSGLRTGGLDALDNGNAYDFAPGGQDKAERAAEPGPATTAGTAAPRAREDAVERAIRAEEAEGPGAGSASQAAPPSGSKLESPIAQALSPGAGRDGGDSPGAGSGTAAGEGDQAERGGRGGKSASGKTGGETDEGDEEREEAGKGRAKGYEGSAASLAPSPLLDYRSRLFSALAQGGDGGNFAAGRRTDAAELREFERRFFDSFRLDSGLAPREDPYSAMLKRRWMAGGGE